MRLIDADSLLKRNMLDKAGKYEEDGYLNREALATMMAYEVKSMIDNEPTVDAEPVRHGEWLPVDELYDAFDCSECDAMVHKPCNYCPKCGAKMDLGG